MINLDLEYPADICSLTNRGEVYLNQGKLVEAAHDFEQAIRLDTDGKHPAANRARFLAILTRKALIVASEGGIEALKDASRRIIGEFSA